MIEGDAVTFTITLDDAIVPGSLVYWALTHPGVAVDVTTGTIPTVTSPSNCYTVAFVDPVSPSDITRGAIQALGGSVAAGTQIVIKFQTQVSSNDANDKSLLFQLDGPDGLGTGVILVDTDVSPPPPP
jgi:hypothetical protein